MSLAREMGCERGGWFLNYLGLPLVGKLFSPYFWDMVLERVRGWTAKRKVVSGGKTYLDSVGLE